MKQSAPVERAAGVEPTEKKPGETFTTGDMARLSNNTLRTVRFYEEAAILTPIGRTEGGHRVFERDQLERLLLVTDMREAGFSLEQIRELLETKQHATSGGAAANAALASLRGHIDALRVKVEVLTRLASDLESTVSCATACLECKDTELFPNRCASCDRIPGQGELPRGMRVLWSIANGAAPAASAAGTNGSPSQDTAKRPAAGASKKLGA